MILVFWGHLSGNGDNPWFPDLITSKKVVYYFHMPLFFILSGLTFHADGSFKEFVTKRVRRLLIPYYFFSLYGLGKVVLSIINPKAIDSFHGELITSPIAQIIEILFGYQGLWFFWALFWGELVLYWIYRCCKKYLPLIAAASSLMWFYCGTCNTGFAYIIKLFPFFFYTVFQALAFVSIGILISDFLKSLDRVGALQMLLVSGVMFSLLSTLLLVYKQDGMQKSVPAIMAAIVGSLFVVAFSILQKKLATIEYIGRNTIVFYGLNGFSIATARAVFFKIIPVSIIAENVYLQVVAGVIIVIVSCVICWLATLIINRWLWMCIGMPRPMRKEMVV
ncbi:acyltransferase [Bifidobacterium dolichotidis]|uniref:Acyltransferase n=2 Tax=Bifidobacterium dolichotidis TaxID=2306976 RepID=A0A430FRR0_9BIFI|nr:acyltransferase [Bifidobacterium dolichotidis]